MNRLIERDRYEQIDRERERYEQIRWIERKKQTEIDRNELSEIDEQIWINREIDS